MKLMLSTFLLLLSQDEILLPNELKFGRNQLLPSVMGTDFQIIPLSVRNTSVFTSKMSLTCFAKIGLEGICIRPWSYCVLYIQVFYALITF